MAKIVTTRFGKHTTTKYIELGELYGVGGNGTGGSEILASFDRISLHCKMPIVDGVKVTNTIWLDRAEAITLAKRILTAANKLDDPIKDIIELAQQRS